MPFPASFLFGTATSATQVEGGCTTSDWYAFAKQPGRIHHGDTPDVACDSWNRWPDDVALMRELGMGAYRLGLEWARIEPRAGEIDRAALDTYRAMLGALRDARIEPMVTLHHFTLPMWLAEKGGVLAPGFAGRLAAFARVAAGALGDLCRLWITVNEPNVLAAHAYLLGVWPPGKRSARLAFRAQRRLLRAHDAAYRALKDARGDAAQVGVAHHLRAVEPEDPRSRADRAAAALFGRVFNDAFAAAACRHGTQDFFGINYYSRDLVRFSPRHAAELFVERRVPPGAPVSDLGWEIYPRGLGEVVRRWRARAASPSTSPRTASPTPPTRGAARSSSSTCASSSAPSTTASTCAATSTGRCSTTSSGPRATPRASGWSPWRARQARDGSARSAGLYARIARERRLPT